jgi:hypothetical protein
MQCNFIRHLYQSLDCGKRMSEFVYRAVYVGLSVDKVVMWQVSPASVILLVLYTHLFIIRETRT